MTLSFAKPRDVTLHYNLIAGKTGARPVVFLNSLGTDFRIWHGVVQALEGMPMLLMDKRGHGLSDSGTTSIDILADDVADLMDMFGLSEAVICGVSIGGLIAQSLAARRPDLMGGLVLSNTGAKIGDADTWDARIDAANSSGTEAMAEAILERWFSREFRADRPETVSGYRNMLVRIPNSDYAATCAAIRDADQTAATKSITAPTICIGGTEDQATPPELVQALAGLISGAEFYIMDGIGHLPCIEAPEFVASKILNLWRDLQ